MGVKRILGVAAAALCAACGGGSSEGSASISGTVRGQTLQPRDAESSHATIPTAVGPAGTLAIAITNQSGLCPAIAANKEPKNSIYFMIFLGVLTTRPDGGVRIVEPSAAGDFSVYSGVGIPAAANVAIVLSQTTDGSCREDKSLGATGVSGTVRVDGISSSGVSGRFDLQVSAGVDSNGNPTGATEHVTGRFSARDCPGLGALLSSTRSTTCI